jgi:hypothetical protein
MMKTLKAAEEAILREFMNHDNTVQNIQSLNDTEHCGILLIFKRT